MFLQETCPASFKIHQSTRFITGNKANPYWAKCDSSFLKSLLSTDSFALSVFLQVLLVVHTLRWSLWELVIFRMLIQVHGIQVLWPEFLHSNQVPRWCWRCGSMDHTLSSRDLYVNRVLLLQRCGFSLFVLLFGIKKKKFNYLTQEYYIFEGKKKYAFHIFHIKVTYSPGKSSTSDGFFQLICWPYAFLVVSYLQDSIQTPPIVQKMSHVTRLLFFL